MGISGSDKLVQRIAQTGRNGGDFRSATADGATTSKPLNKRLEPGARINTVQYIGIAADEPERIARHKGKPGVMLPLVEIGWTEADCRKWCEENGLLSPIYTDSMRGGCWFCHNQSVNQLRLLRRNYPELWAKLLALDYDSPLTFRADGHTVHDFEIRFQWEDDGFLQSGKQFRWDDVYYAQFNLMQFLHEIQRESDD